MRSTRKAWVTAAAATVIAGSITTLAVSVPTATASAPDPAEHGLVGGEGSTCFWYYGGVGDDPLYNIAYPDAGATYWAAYYRRPAGSTLTLNGKYPHARYFSFISYDRAGQPVDGIADYQIEPDADSRNPFRPGARRNTPAKHRNFTVSLDHEANYDPATGKPEHTIRDPRNDEPARNDLAMVPTPILGQVPLGTEIGSDGIPYQTELLVMRLYAPDTGKDVRGGFPLPEAKPHARRRDRAQGAGRL